MKKQNYDKVIIEPSATNCRNGEIAVEGILEEMGLLAICVPSMKYDFGN